MVIEILQAGTGDSIWVSHNKKNIVIDGGKSTAFSSLSFSAFSGWSCCDRVSNS